MDRRQPAEACDAFVGIFNGYRDDTGNRWTSTAIGTAVVVEQGVDVSHLRVEVMRRFDDGSALAADADVFLVREDGAWRLAVPSLLWEFSDSDLGTPPTALAQLPPLLDALRREVEGKRAIEEGIVRDYLATRTRLASRPLRWTGATSSAVDPLRDIVSQSGERIADQTSPRNDLRGASLRSDGQTLTFELRFRDRVPRELGISFGLQQLRWESRRRGTTLGVTARWSVQLADGWASAERGDAEQPEAIADVRASASGRTVRLALPAGAVREEVRLGRPFRWQLETWQAPPIGLFDDAPVRAWRDLLPNRQAHVPGAGVLHRP
ncbi:MAG TPA: hypothetical protein VLK58_26715 [Conexibacter sp.]|nr:hypothetical protein [Conexibacter sp.]